MRGVTSGTGQGKGEGRQDRSVQRCGRHPGRGGGRACMLVLLLMLGLCWGVVSCGFLGHPNSWSHSRRYSKAKHMTLGSVDSCMARNVKESLSLGPRERAAKHARMISLPPKSAFHSSHLTPPSTTLPTNSSPSQSSQSHNANKKRSTNQHNPHPDPNHNINNNQTPNRAQNPQR